MSKFTIPILDLNDYRSVNVAAKDNFIEDLGKALQDVGFFALVNSGVDFSLVGQTYDLQKQLFDLPLDLKLSYENEKLKGQRGYISFGKEHAKGFDAPDLKEFWHVGQELDETDPFNELYAKNIWPKEVTGFKSASLKLYDQLEQCALTLLESCALYAGEETNRFSSIAEKGNSIMRMIHYPPIPDDVNPASVRAAAHEDINLITLLVAATTSGLEIQLPDGSWMPVVTPDDCIIVDSGDMLQNITNGFYRATTHRVVNPDNSRVARMSIPFFVHARSDASLSPLASCINKTGGEQSFPNITAGDFLSQRLAEIGF